ncbi:hypothetical protein POTOM_058743 [Populus tomentosa]|uniref:BURP domain-containing protein n=1 Tax=Populus tomentosa TaxID=118781 RepID=A0A8X7Y136_POPTO|nr:hypothetical protein POTOM_058743 [Populus tomentosa]
MTFLFTTSGTKVSFLPRQVAESIPFSSDKIPEILKWFAPEVTSKEAQVIRDEIGGAEHGMRRQICTNAIYSKQKIHEVPTSMFADVAKVKAATVCPSNHQLGFQDRVFDIFVVTDSLFRVPTKDQEKTP